MKKILLKNILLSFILLNSTSLYGIAKTEFWVYQTETPPTIIEGVSQKILSQMLVGKYQLKFENTLENRTWHSARAVGLSFFPDTYLYSTGNLNFNIKTSKVELSSISPIETLPDVKFGSCTFYLIGSRLTIKYNKKKNYGKLVVVSLKNHWLIVEDVRIKKRWAFYKIEG
jgi:hypothetical protein